MPIYIYIPFWFIIDVDFIYFNWTVGETSRIVMFISALFGLLFILNISIFNRNSNGSFGNGHNNKKNLVLICR